MTWQHRTPGPSLERGQTAVGHHVAALPRLPGMRRRCLGPLLVLLCLSLTTTAAPALPRGRVFPLTRRDGVSRTRGLLRNASLPLHGAIRDYVSRCCWSQHRSRTLHIAWGSKLLSGAFIKWHAALRSRGFISCRARCRATSMRS